MPQSSTDFADGGYPTQSIRICSACNYQSLIWLLNKNWMTFGPKLALLCFLALIKSTSDFQFRTHHTQHTQSINESSEIKKLAMAGCANGVLAWSGHVHASNQSGAYSGLVANEISGGQSPTVIVIFQFQIKLYCLDILQSNRAPGKALQINVGL